MFFTKQEEINIAFIMKAVEDITLNMDLSAKQIEFLSSNAQITILRAGNQLGKTLMGAMELAFNALGFHPFKPEVARKAAMRAQKGQHFEALCIGRTAATTRDVLGKNLSDVIPHYLLEDKCRYNPSSGWPNQTIKFKNGSVIKFATTGSDPVDAIAGRTVDIIWTDEPTTKDVFDEALQRVVVKNGRLIITFTPIGEDLTWLKESVEGKTYFDYGLNKNVTVPPAFNSDVLDHIVMKLEREEVPWMSDDEYEKRIIKLEANPETMRQRRYGDWEGTNASAGFTFSRHLNVKSAQEIKTMFGDIRNTKWKYRLGIDHGQYIGKQVAVLCAVNSETKDIVVLSEYVNTKETTIEQDAKNIVAMLTSFFGSSKTIESLIFSNRLVLYGDINGVGMKTGGKTSINSLLEKNIAKELSVKQDALKINIPYKKSVMERELYMEEMLKKQKLLLFNTTCGSTITCFEQYEGNNKSNSKYKNNIDAVGYALSKEISEYYKPQVTNRSLDIYGF